MSMTAEIRPYVHTTVDDIAAVVAVAAVAARPGQGASLAKVDIESAYCLILAHPDDRPLQGMLWEGQIYIDPRLPFGLRSAPKNLLCSSRRSPLASISSWNPTPPSLPGCFHYPSPPLIPRDPSPSLTGSAPF